MDVLKALSSAWQTALALPAWSYTGMVVCLAGQLLFAYFGATSGAKSQTKPFPPGDPFKWSPLSPYNDYEAISEIYQYLLIVQKYSDLPEVSGNMGGPCFWLGQSESARAPMSNLVLTLSSCELENRIIPRLSWIVVVHRKDFVKIYGLSKRDGMPNLQPSLSKEIDICNIEAGDSLRAIVVVTTDRKADASKINQKSPPFTAKWSIKESP